MSGQDQESGTQPAGVSAWRIIWTALILALLTGIFFRSVLPLVPQLFLRGRLRVNRIGLRGVRGIEWRSKGFDASDGPDQQQDDRVHIKVQMIYAVLRRPRWSRQLADTADSSSIRSRSLLTIHIRGVGVRLAPSKHDEASLKRNLQKAKEKEAALKAEEDRQRKEAEERLEVLMRSSDNAAQVERPPPSELLDCGSQHDTHRQPRGHVDIDVTVEKSSMHRAGLLSLNTVLQLATWTRATLVPAVRGFVLRFFRAAVFLITSSLPSLTSLVDIQVHRIEIYLQEAEAVARIGRAGIEFSMAVVSAREQQIRGRGHSGLQQHAVVPELKPPSWSDVFRAAARMPTRIGSGARGAASYLMEGLPDGKACFRLRVEGVQLFEADLDAGGERCSTTATSGTATFAPASAASASLDRSKHGSPTPRSRRRHASSHSRSESLTTMDAAFEVMHPSGSSYDWPDLGSPRSLSPPSTLKRSNSASMLDMTRGVTLNGFTDRWADWALEPLADSDFSTETSWMRGDNSRDAGPLRRVTIPEGSRLLSLPRVSELQIGVLLGTDFSFKAKETVDLSVIMCETSVGLDAFLRVASILESRKAQRSGWSSTVEGLEERQRSVVSKHLAKQEKALPKAILETISSFAFSVPTVRVVAYPKARLDTDTAPHGGRQPHLPERLLFEAELTGFHFEIGTSSTTNEMHQRWLGACGVNDHLSLQRANARKPPSKATLGHRRKRSSEGRSAAALLPTTSRFKRRALVEHRRAFVLDVGLASFELHCGLQGQAHDKRSELLFVGDLAIGLLSTWTPFGILTSASHHDGQGPPLYFVGDFNEETAVVSADVGRISGAVQLDHLAELVRLGSFFAAKRAATRAKMQIDNHHRGVSDVETLQRVPRLIAGIEFSGIEYVIDVGSQGQGEPASTTFHQERKLVLSMPHLSANFAGDYRDQYVKRPDAEKRTYYKALKKDELEWPLKGSASGHLFNVEALTGNRAAQMDERVDAAEGEFVAADGLSESANMAATGSADIPLARFSPECAGMPAEELSIEEAVKRMVQLQTAGKPARPPLPTRNSTVRDAHSRPGKVRLPGYSRRSTMAAETLYTHKYQFEASVQVEAVEAFLTLGGSSASSRRSFFGAFATGTEVGPNVGSAQHHLLALHTFELSGAGAVPGNVTRCGVFDEIEVPWISAKDGVANVRGSVEDIDVELWHPAALQVYLHLSDRLTDAKAPFDPSLFEDGRGDQAEASPGLGVPQEIAQPQTQTAEEGAEVEDALTLIDHLPKGLTVYLSIGQAIAHLGSSDPQCDPHLTHGIGLESKRIVLEYSAAIEAKHNLAHHKGGWGARSALELPQDLRLQALSLSSRHGRAALARLTLFETGLFPILDAAQAMKQQMEGTAEDAEDEANDSLGQDGGGATHDRQSRCTSDADKSDGGKGSAVFADAVWDFHGPKQGLRQTKRKRPKFRQQDRSNFIFWMPISSYKATIRPRSPTPAKPGQHPAEEVTITSEDSRLVALKVDLLHTYCLLLTASMLRNLASRRPAAATATAPRPTAKPYCGSSPTARTDTTPAAAAPKGSPSGRGPTVGVHLSFNDVHVTVTLPRKVHLFLRLRRIELRKKHAAGLSVVLELILAAVESPKATQQELWETAVRLQDFKVIMSSVSPGEKRRIEVNGDSASITIPFGYQINKIIDNASVAFKATKQLIHQFVKGGTDSVIVPVGEEPKHLPDVSMRIRIFVLAAQDDPFETRLNIIWRAGYDENRAREEREVAFQAKAAEVLAAQETRSMMSFQSDSDGSYFAGGSGSSEGGSPRSESSPGYGRRLAAVDLEEAREALDSYNSSSWARRCRNAKAEQARRQDAAMRRISGRLPVRPDDDLPIRLAQASKSAPLFRSSMSDVFIEVGEPAELAGDKLRNFIHEQGGGIPKDTAFSLLLPIHLRWRMKEWRISLRDYPLPLLHVPPVSAKQPGDFYSWDLEAGFVVAEQLGGPESIRHVPAVVVPAATGQPDAVEYSIMIPKVAMPVKLYGSPKVSIHSSYPTRLLWGQSVQPAIQDVVRVIDGITSPPHDPSPKLGFWDKIPLIMHGALAIDFAGESDFNLHLKGSRDPYQITEQAVGWVKCWRGGVKIRLGHPNDDREVFQILSHEYLLAIPDLSDYTDTAATGVAQEERDYSTSISEGRDGGEQKSYDTSLGSSNRRYMKDPTFSKVVLKLTNGVKWGAGLHLERTCDEDSCRRTPRCQGEAFYRECRIFERIPHWEVITKTRAHVDSLPDSEKVDSFRGWRSDHIHFSLSVFSPGGGLPEHGGAGETDEPCRSSKGVSNNFYFTPLAWAHFWAWMRLFSSAMGLPIRHGSLFPDSAPVSPKFGRHLGTIKYRIDLQPLFITHQYIQFIKLDWARGMQTFLGIKARLGVFRLDLHQRQQETVKEKPELGAPKIVFHKPFYEAEVECTDIDLRMLCAQFSDPTQRLLLDSSDGFDETPLDDIFTGRCSIPDSDLEWNDMNDFVELEVMPLNDPRPKLKLYPALSCPAFNYYRKIDSQRERKAKEDEYRNKGGRRDRPPRTGSTSSDADRDTEALMASLERSKFGDEETHACLVGKGREPTEIQEDLAGQRLASLRQEMEKLKAGDDSYGLPTVPSAASSDDSDASVDEDVAARLDDLARRERLVLDFTDHLRKLRKEAFHGGGRADSSRLEAFTNENFGMGQSDLASPYQDIGNFDNRYFAHNPTLYLSNATRTVLLKYYYSSRIRRGYCHHMTATAVRYIRDLVLKNAKKPPGEGRCFPKCDGKCVPPCDRKPKRGEEGYALDGTMDGDSSGEKGADGRAAEALHNRNSVAAKDVKTHDDVKDDTGGTNDKAETDGQAGTNLVDSRKGMGDKDAEKDKDRNDEEDATNAEDGKEKKKPEVEKPRQASGPRKRYTNSAAALREMLDEALRYAEMDDGTSNEAHGDVTNPGDGISDEYIVKSSNICLFLKPQIVLRSDVDERSTVVFTALRARLHNYTVLDESCAEDSVNAIVLRRNFFALDSLQCFHPTQSCRFLRSASERFGFVFVPLETLIDLKHQTKDFDRIVPRTNAHVFYDKFNKLRLSDSSRTVAVLDADGEPKYDHLYHRMDLIRVRCPRFTISASKDHFAALYNVVTDLILYRDPVHRDHAKRLEEAMFSHDFTKLAGLSEVVTALQDRIRDTYDLARQYYENLDKLTEHGRVNLYALAGEFVDLLEELNLIMEAITAAQDSKGGADREKKSALRVDAHAKDLSWNMMGDDDGQLLAKLALRGISFAWLNKADNSAFNTLSLQDLQALNVRPDAIFAEIITKYHKAPNHPMARKGRFLDAMWSVLPPVGGISIIDHFELTQHPTKVQIEMRIGRQIQDYIFGSQKQRKAEEQRQKRIEAEERKRAEQAAAKAKKSPLARLLHGVKKSNQMEEARFQTASASTSASTSATVSSSDLASLHRESLDSMEIISADAEDDDSFETKSHHSGGRRFGGGSKKQADSVVSKDSSRSRPGTPTTKASHGSDDEEGRGGQFAIARRNAAEMRTRAAAYRTFVNVMFDETVFCLSYKAEKQKSITDLYDVVFRAPGFGVKNRTFGYIDLAEAFKKEIIRAAWSQKATLIKGALTHKPQRRKAAIEHIKAIRHGKSRDVLTTLDVQLQLQPPTPDGSSSSPSTMLDSAVIKSPLETDSLASRDSSTDGVSSDGSSRVNITTASPEGRVHQHDPRDDDDYGGGGGDDDNTPRVTRYMSLMLPVPSPGRSNIGNSQTSDSSPAFKLGKFLSRNFRTHSESASDSISSSRTVSMSRNSSAHTAEGSLSPSSSNESHRSVALRRRSDVGSDSGEQRTPPCAAHRRCTLGQCEGSTSRIGGWV